MRLLVLVRHAKAEAPQAGVEDHARALAVAGREASVRLAERLKAAGIVPDLALVSSANRAVQTFKRMATVLGDIPLLVEDDLYESARERYMTALTNAGEAQVVMVVGHEPTTSHVAAWLAGEGSLKKPMQKIALGLTTSGAAVLEYDGEWSDLGRRSARLIGVIDGKAS